MPAATNRADLIARTQDEFAKLDALLERVPPPLRSLPEPGADATTIKDIVGHRAHWITLFLGWYADGQAGKPVAFPAPGYNWGDLKRFNADLRARQQDLDWNAARALLADSHRGLVGFVSNLSQDALYGGPMKGARNAWTPGRRAEAAGASHYRSAAKYIRARLRAQTSARPAKTKV